MYKNGKKIRIAAGLNDLCYFKFPAGEFGFDVNFVREVNSQYMGDGTNQNYSLLIQSNDLGKSDDIIKIMLVSDALKRRYPFWKQHLFIPYFPYGRQDRICNNGEPLSVKVIADIINSANFEIVFTMDDHSDVIGALLNNHVQLLPEDFFYDSQNQYGKNKTVWLEFYEKDLKKKNDVVIISPDAGSLKKCFRISKKYKGVPVVRADKIRDTKTGDIIGTMIYDDVDGKNCIIIDDICDGGRTFIELAKVLKEKGAKRVALYVTHGIFSKGFDVFDGIIDEIYTTDSSPVARGDVPKNVHIRKIDIDDIDELKWGN